MQGGGAYQVGADCTESGQGQESTTAAQTTLGVTPYLRPPTSLDSLRGPTPRRRGKTPKDTTHHSPPKQTSRATQNFSIRAPREGQEMD